MIIPTKKGDVFIASFDENGIDWFKPHAVIGNDGLKEYQPKWSPQRLCQNATKKNLSSGSIIQFILPSFIKCKQSL